MAGIAPTFETPTLPPAGRAARAGVARAPARPTEDAAAHDGPAESLFDRKWFRWTAGFAVWTVLGVLSAMQAYLFMRYIGRPQPLGPILLSRLADWYTCAVFTPVFFWLARRYPIDRQAWGRGLLVHAPAIAAMVVLKFAMFHPIGIWLDGPGSRSLERTVVGSFYFEFVAFACVAAVVHAMEFYRKFREREVRAAQLETRLAVAHLEVLKMQLHPHFLFNTLHAISTLMHRDVEAADEMVTELSDLLRLTLAHTGRQELPLKEELDVLGRYIGIMQIRFGDRLRASVDADPEVLDALVPTLILQPLVENAIRHGIAEHAGAGAVRVTARREGDALTLEVADDGPGLPAGPREGVGLANTRARLAQLYGSAHRFALQNRPPRGVAAVLTIPFRTAAAEAAPEPQPAPALASAAGR